MNTELIFNSFNLHIFNECLSSRYISRFWHRAVNQINKNVCPRRAFILMGDIAKKKDISKIYEC